MWSCSWGQDEDMTVTSIQRVIDLLAADLSCPTAVDDTDFALLHYSPQHGPLDQVRVDSILHRDSPDAAKQWVVDQGVRDANGVCRVRGAPDLGLLPRICAPIRYDHRTLGYLWVIDAHEQLDDGDLEHIRTAADRIAPILYRSRTLAVLDRQHERAALADLLSRSRQRRKRGVDRFESSGILRAGGTLRVLVVEASLGHNRVFDDDDQLGLEGALERCRGSVTENEIALTSRGHRGTVLIVDRRDAGAQSFAEEALKAVRSRVPSHRWVVGIGSSQESLERVWTSFEDASRSVRVLIRVPFLGDLINHANLGVYDILAGLPDDMLTERLVPSSLRQLIAKDRDGDLVTTLEAYLEAAGDAAATAQRLHVHRSTVYTRLQRIEQITGRWLGDGSDRLLLHVGLALLHFVETEQAPR